MKLYKYTTLDAAVKIIEGEAIHFARMSDFNDPFEGPMPESPKDLDQFQEDIYPIMFKRNICDNFVVLSLTRTPFNPLMWSHYGGAYTGCVIEIDTEKAGFNDENLCAVPAQYGDIIYTTQPPEYQYAQAIIDKNYTPYAKFSPASYLSLRSAFLYKHTSWAYEEEVRIVKYLNTQTRERSIQCRNSEGTWSIKAKPSYQYKNGKDGKRTSFQIDDFLNLFHIPRECITKVYIGSKLKRMTTAPSYQNHFNSDPAFNNIANLKKIESYGVSIVSTSAMIKTRTINTQKTI